MAPCIYWSLINPGNGNTPALAPIYHVLSTVPCIQAGYPALSLGGERAFKVPTVVPFLGHYNAATPLPARFHVFSLSWFRDVGDTTQRGASQDNAFAIFL